MAKYVKVKFYKGFGTEYTYLLPDNLKAEKLKPGEPIVVPVGTEANLKVAYIVQVTGKANIPPHATLKQAYGLVRKI